MVPVQTRLGAILAFASSGAWEAFWLPAQPNGRAGLLHGLHQKTLTMGAPADVCEEADKGPDGRGGRARG